MRHHFRVHIAQDAFDHCVARGNDNLSREIGGQLTRIRHPFCGFSAFHDGHITRLNKINGFDLTKADTLGIAVTDVALEDPPVGGIEIHCTKGAYADTRTAANAGIIVNADAA